MGVLRLILGRTVVGQVAAVDMLTVISISVIALYAHVSGRFIYLDVALVASTACLELSVCPGGSAIS